MRATVSSCCKPRVDTNPARGEVVADFGDGSQFIARPTLEAVTWIERERGPIVEVAGRLSSAPSFEDCVAVLAACIRAGGTSIGEQWVASLVLRSGVDAAARWSSALVASYFVRGEHASDARADGTPKVTFPALDFVAQAVAVWGASTADAWRWTVPEWWAVFDAFVMANGGPTKKKNGVSSDEAHRLADLVRTKKREERAANELILLHRAEEEQNGSAQIPH